MTQKKVTRWVIDATDAIESHLPHDHPSRRMWTSATSKLMGEGHIGLLQSPVYIDMLSGILESAIDKHDTSDSTQD